jgi:crossover junction endodeoxyribonuclease RusA
VVIELTYFWPDRRRCDTHNRIRELMDVLQAAGAFANDCQALAHERDFRVDARRPRVEIAVRKKRS